VRAQVVVDVRPVLDHLRLHVRVHARVDVIDDVGDEVLPFGVGHDVAVQHPRLREIVVVGVLLVGVPADFRRFDPPAELARQLRVSHRTAVGVWRVHRLRPGMLVGHRAVLVVGVDSRLRRVDRQLLVVRADPVQVRVVVGEDPPHQHLVGAKAGTGHEVGRVETRLLDFGEVVSGVAVQDHPANRDRRVVRVRPDFGQVEGVEPVVRCVGPRHYLHLQPPLRGVAASDRLP
jgi:hypothetical protein